MLKTWGFIAGVICLSSVALADDPAQQVMESEMSRSANAVWRERRLQLGKDVYQHACASCHDAGINGAPAIGDRQAWSRRSPMWSAVLFEHSRNGYLEMPARGLNGELTDQEVDAASEYLLSKTFPELPLD